MYLNEFIEKSNKIIFEYEEPLKYLRGRGLTDKDIREYQLGYVRVARIKKEESEDYKTLWQSTYEFRGLQNKIIFPLKNVLGKVHGISVRDIERKQYVHYFLNEAKKIGALFGLCEALPRIKETRKVFVHEGAINAISFAKVFKNTVSSLTSFLNEQQYELLTLYVDKIILVYDSDTAGNHGITKSLQTYGQRHIETVYIGTDDSNDYLRMMGVEKFTKYIKSKVPILFQ
jgi:DNA primase